MLYVYRLQLRSNMMQTASIILPPRLLLSDSTLYVSQEDIYVLESSSGAIIQRYSLPGVTYPTLANDVLYVNISHHPDYFVQALSRSDGVPFWSYQLEGRHSSHAPVIVDETVYISSVEGSIYALQARDGALLWQSAIDGDLDTLPYPSLHICTSPTVSHEIVYIAPQVNPPLKPFLSAFRAKDGTFLWRVQLPEASAFPFAVVGSVLYLSTSHGCSALRANDGSLLWQRELGETTLMCSSPLVLEGRVYLSLSETEGEFSSLASGDEVRQWQHSSICALQASDGSLLWQQSLGEATSANRPTGLSIQGDMLYVGTQDGDLFACRSDDGTVRWRYQTNATLLSSPTATSEIVYVGDNSGYVYALRARDGVLLWQTFVSTAVTSTATLRVQVGEVKIV
jgi:outer membrane protein assembly factor BamB